MNLAIDIGNTRIKAGLFAESELLQSVVFDTDDECQSFFEKSKPSLRGIIVSSVKKDIPSYLKNLSSEKGTLIFNHATPLPFLSVYKTPETLGLDRLAGIAGAMQIFPSQNLLVIDAGTCITYDLLDDRGTYRGGAISPGLRMRYLAMNGFTDKLPLLNTEDFPEYLGQSTSECMQAGAQNGWAEEVKGMMEEYRKSFNDLKIVLTGGDANFLNLKLKNRIFADSFLILKGLEKILRYNNGSYNYNFLL